MAKCHDAGMRERPSQMGLATVSTFPLQMGSNWEVSLVFDTPDPVGYFGSLLISRHHSASQKVLSGSLRLEGIPKKDVLSPVSQGSGCVDV